MLPAAAQLRGLPRIEGFGIGREDFGIFFMVDRFIDFPDLPVLKIRFAKNFTPGEDGANQRRLIASALVGPTGEHNDQLDRPQFTENTVRMGFINIWAAKAALDRIFWLYSG